ALLVTIYKYLSSYFSPIQFDPYDIHGCPAAATLSASRITTIHWIILFHAPPEYVSLWKNYLSMSTTKVVIFKSCNSSHFVPRVRAMVSLFLISIPKK
uniref:Uncharacterized protein n=1 Tax=Wuchereria bancrofti TaxID=6293 RepID=A0AAF5PHI6_WUCBA